MMTMNMWDLVAATEKMEKMFGSHVRVHSVHACVDGISFRCEDGEGKSVTYKWFRIDGRVQRISYWRDVARKV